MSSPVTVTGKLVDSSGNPLAGTVSFLLSWDCWLADDTASIVQSKRIDALAAADGAFSLTLWSNADLEPVGSSYTVTEHYNGSADASYSIVVPHGGGNVAALITASPPVAAQFLAVVSPLAAADATIVVGGTIGAPTVKVGVIAESQVTGLPADLADIDADIGEETTRATAAEAANATAITSEAATARAAESANATAITSEATTARTAEGLRELLANKGAANGYAPLDNGSRVPTANLPVELGGVYDVSFYVSPQAAIDAAPGGSVVAFPAAAYTITTELTIVKPLTVRLGGATLTQSTGGHGHFAVTSPHVTIEGGTLVGSQYLTQVQAEKAIKIVGASASSPLSDVHVRNVNMSTLGGWGIYAEYANDCSVVGCAVTNVWYTGIGGLSCLRWNVGFNEVTNVISAPGIGLGYGILFSRNSTDSLVIDPMSADCIVHDNVINGVPNWVGLNTHGGQGIQFVDNIVLGTLHGIEVTNQNDSHEVSTWAPNRCVVANNYIDSQRADGGAGHAIIVNGACPTTGSPTELAKGCVVQGNTVVGHGPESNSNDAALFFYGTQSLVVADNNVDQPSPTGIMLYHDNYGFNVAGNTVTDAWSNTVAVGEAWGICVRSAYNTGYIGANSLNRPGIKTGTTYLMTSGVRTTAGATNSTIILGPNYNEGTLPLNDGANVCTFTVRSPLVASSTGSFAGLVTASTVPTAGGHLTNKTYVDAADALAAKKASNLSDLANAATARTNLGLAAVAASGSAADLASGTLPTGRFPGGAFNGASELVQLDGSGHLPALNGAALTAIPESGVTGLTADLAALYSLTSQGGLTSGEATIPRLMITSVAEASASGRVMLSYFIASKTETIANIRGVTGTTAAGATPTLCRMGLYSVDGSGNLTLLAACANDTTLFASVSTQWIRALTASVTKTQGQLYAFAYLVVTVAAMPTFIGSTPGAGLTALQVEFNMAPRLNGLLNGQTDLPGSIAAGSVANCGQSLYGVVTP